MTDLLPPTSDPRFDIVIVAFNSSMSIRECVSSMLDQNGVDVDVVVVDNGSADAESSELALAELGTRGVRFVRHTANLGYAAGAAVGLPLTRGAEHVIVANPDLVLLDPGYLRAVAEVLRDPTVGVVGARQQFSDGSRQRGFGVWPAVWSEVLASLHLLGPLLDLWFWAAYSRRSRAFVNVPWVDGAFLALRRHVYDDIGGLDSGYFLYFEDMDLSRMAAARSLRRMLPRDVVARHDRGGSSGGVRRSGRPELAVTYGRSYARFLLRHERPVRAALILLVARLRLWCEMAASMTVARAAGSPSGKGAELTTWLSGVRAGLRCGNP